MIHFQRVLLGRKTGWFHITKGHSRSQNLFLVFVEWHCIKMANHKICSPVLETVFSLWTITLSKLYFYKVLKYEFIQQ